MNDFDTFAYAAGTLTALITLVWRATLAARRPAPTPRHLLEARRWRMIGARQARLLTRARALLHD